MGCWRPHHKLVQSLRLARYMLQDLYSARRFSCYGHMRRWCESVGANHAVQCRQPRFVPVLVNGPSRANAMAKSLFRTDAGLDSPRRLPIGATDTFLRLDFRSAGENAVCSRALGRLRRGSPKEVAEGGTDFRSASPLGGGAKGLASTAEARTGDENSMFAQPKGTPRDIRQQPSRIPPIVL